MNHRTLLLISLVIPLVAHADVDKYKAKDQARAAIIEALDKGDAATFATYLAPAVDVSGLWFDTAACRKKFAKVASPKTAPAFVACISPLHVYGKGLNVYYGPGVAAHVKIDVAADGKATLVAMTGDPALDPTLPKVAVSEFTSHKTAGDPIILDTAALAELATVHDTGAVVDLCVDAKGAVNKSRVKLVKPTGATSKLVATALEGWTFTPFTVRDKPRGACSTIVVKAAP